MSENYHSSGFRAVFVQVLIYTALALVPVKMPILEIVPEPPHAIVQPMDGLDPDLDELVARLGVEL